MVGSRIVTSLPLFRAHELLCFLRFAHKCKVSTLASYHLDSKQGTHMKHEYLMVLSVSVYDGPEYATLWYVFHPPNPQAD